MTLLYDIQPCMLVDRYTAVCRGEMAAGDLPAWLSSAFHTVQEYLKRVRVTPAGPPFARFTFLNDMVAVEAGFPLYKEIACANPVELSTLPDGQAVVATHVGRYEDLQHAYEAIHEWLHAHRFTAAGPHWEVYYTDPSAEPDPSQWRTDVVQPYRTTSAPTFEEEGRR